LVAAEKKGKDGGGDGGMKEMGGPGKVTRQKC